MSKSLPFVPTDSSGNTLTDLQTSLLKGFIGFDNHPTMIGIDKLAEDKRWNPTSDLQSSLLKGFIGFNNSPRMSDETDEFSENTSDLKIHFDSLTNIVIFLTETQKLLYKCRNDLKKEAQLLAESGSPTELVQRNRISLIRVNREYKVNKERLRDYVAELQTTRKTMDEETHHPEKTDLKNRYGFYKPADSEKRDEAHQDLIKAMP